MTDYSTIARKKCHDCLGTGHPDPEKNMVCGCVYRRMFRECLNRYHACRSRQASFSSDVLEEIKHVLCSRPHEDYIVDFERVCTKALGKDASRLAAFECLLFEVEQRERLAYGITSHELISLRSGVPLKTVPGLLVDLSTFLGRVLHEVQPYPLYPTKHYFGVPIKRNLFRSMPKKQPHPLLDIKNRDTFLDCLLKGMGHSKASIRRTNGISRQGRLARSFMRRPDPDQE